MEDMFENMNTEEKDRLDVIVVMIDEYLATGADMLLSTQDFLDRIKTVAKGEEIKVEETQKLEHIIISCDASIKQNPGGPAAIGFVVQFPAATERPNIEIAVPTPDTTNNLAEYSAVYQALVTLMSLVNNPGCPIEVRTDSQLVVKQIKGEITCKNPKLASRRDAICELIAALPVPVSFVWRPRNSTTALMQANFLAQDLLGVPRH